MCTNTCLFLTVDNLMKESQVKVMYCENINFALIVFKQFMVRLACYYFATVTLNILKIVL